MSYIGIIDSAFTRGQPDSNQARELYLQGDLVMVDEYVVDDYVAMSDRSTPDLLAHWLREQHHKDGPSTVQKKPGDNGDQEHAEALRYAREKYVEIQAEMREEGWLPPIKVSLREFARRIGRSYSSTWDWKHRNDVPWPPA